MKNRRKNIDELNLSDSFMFANVMSDKTICRMFLEKLLDIEIDEIEVAEYEKTILAGAADKHVRLDIYVKDVSGKVYDIEMQNSSKREYSLAKRARYYQSVIDTEELKEGKHYDELPESYIIFICAFDEFGLAKSKYSFSYRCNETPELLLQNGANVVILNTRGTEDTDVDKDIAAFLGYVESSSQKVAQNSGSEFLRYVHERFEHVKKEKRGDFMTLQEYLDDEIAERLEEAVAEAAKAAAEEVKLKMAANMRKEGFDPAVIARITGLTEEAFSG